MTQVVIDAQSPSIGTRALVVPQGACEAIVDRCLCRLLDRTPSERSEDKLVFLINVRPCVSSPRRKLRRPIVRAAAERVGIDDESDQVP